MRNRPETDDNNQHGILGACETAFSTAYEKHSEGVDYITKQGDAELMRLHTTDPDLDIILGRPHLGGIVSSGLAFWVDRIRLDPIGSQKPLPKLVATVDDPERLHITDHDDDPREPISQEDTAKIAELIANGQPVPVNLEQYGA